MKLSNQQIDALVSKVYKAKQEAIKKKLDDKKSSLAKETAQKTKKISSEIKKLSKESLDYIKKHSYNKSIFQESEVKVYIENQISLEKTKLETMSDIKNSVVLASIDSNDLAELSKKLGIDLS